MKPNTAPRPAAYGTWPSSISAAAVAAGQVNLDYLRCVDGRLQWIESVPSAGGISRLFALTHAGVVALSPPTMNVRTRVHEYGGTPYACINGTVVCCNYRDQLWYLLPESGAAADASPVALTTEGRRYADAVAAPAATHSQRALVCVREDHSDPTQVRNTLVRLGVDAPGGDTVVYDGSDFVAAPRFSRDGRQLAFVSWEHPHMPWDAARLQVAAWSGGVIHGKVVAGGEDESVLDPSWSLDGRLYFLSDRNGFWNLHVWDGQHVHCVWNSPFDCGSATWVLGQSNFALLDARRALVRFVEQGLDRVALVDLPSGRAQRLPLPYVEFSNLVALDDRTVAAVAGSPEHPRAIVAIDVDAGSARVLHAPQGQDLAPSAVSVAVPRSFDSVQGRRVHAFYYAPTNAGFTGIPGEAPPLVTLVHGGPTSRASPALQMKIQFWTSRGFGVVDVNYGGSTGFGRAYRQALQGRWGVMDVEDVVTVVQALAQEGKADPRRLAISGGSAGGFTVLAALSTSAIFAAGANYYGVSDLGALAKDTHKFESRYLDGLIGPLPDCQAEYDRRSPINNLGGFHSPLIVFQGALDPVVPPDQSERIVDALRARGVPVAYVLYPDETHGFRNPANVIQSLQSELYFYGRIFGFTPSDELPPVVIENLAPAASFSR